MSGREGFEGRRQDEYGHLAPLFDELAGCEPDDPRRHRIREELITGHLPLAEHVARRFMGRGIDSDDLEQVARVGLINAVDRFDPRHGTDFLSFAVPTVMGEVRRHFRDRGWSMRVPRRLQELSMSISVASDAIVQRVGRAPTPRELAEHLGVDVEEVYEGLEAGEAYRSASLDGSPGTGDGRPLGETIGADDGGLAVVENQEALEPVIRALPDRERRVLGLRFFKNMTQTQIAEQIGVSQMQVSRLLARSLARIRSELQDSE